MCHSQIMRSLFQVLVLGLTASACGAQQPEAIPSDLVRGHYIFGLEVNVFSPCGSDLEHWVEAEPEILKSLTDQYWAFDLPPYEAVFVEFRGEFGPVLDCGFCEVYDGSFRITEVLAVRLLGPEDCETEMGGGATANGT